MEATLVTITLLALVTTLVMAGVAWMLMREERRRFDARVSMLAAGLDAPDSPHLAARRHQDWRGDESVGMSGDPLAAFPSQRAAVAASGVAVPGMFGTTAGAATDIKGRLLPALVTGAILMSACLAVVLLLSSIPAASAPAAVARAIAADQSQPLELLQVESLASPGRIQLSGVVRNPTGGSELVAVTAVASFFAADGRFVGSSRFTLPGPLRASQEAPFSIVGDVMGTVARYRVSFRGAHDAPLSHVDRREGR